MSGEPPDKGGGQPPGTIPPVPIKNPPAATTSNDLSSMTPTMVGDRLDDLPCRMRNFAEILNEEQHHRNILEVKLIRTSEVNSSGDLEKVKTLNEVDLSEFLFDVMQLKMQDCEGLVLRTHRYDTKEIKLKKGVNPAPFLTTSPKLFKGPEISIKKQMNNQTKVTFKNVPFNIPDEEIIHLCSMHGEPVTNIVHYEKPSRNTRGVPGSTRFVEMKMTAGKQFENYYWMEGPLSGDQGCRITVLHNGQVQQCSHCLRRANLCHGGGNGRACESLKTQRGRLIDYMKYLKESHGYTSLKMKYMMLQFPALGGPRETEDGFGHIVENGEEQETNTLDKDLEIENLKKQISDKNLLQQKLVESEAKVKFEKINTRTAVKKLEHVQKVASQRIVENMPCANFEDDSNHLAMLLGKLSNRKSGETCTSSAKSLSVGTRVTIKKANKKKITSEIQICLPRCTEYMNTLANCEAPQ